MQIYLLKDVAGKGKRGEVISVNDGYGKNFLVKNGYGKVADNSVMSQVNSKKQSITFHKEQDIEATKKICARLEGVTVTIIAKMGANGKMFGGITGTEIAGELNKQGFEIDKKDLVFDAIRGIGEYKIKVKFNHGLTAQFALRVTEGK
ncbi:MAG: 50S ribosomal protein L9 [Christensenellaceae bacterium]|jgi:large subunit ribosomal protein L9|nr:50S ribosomal protein L9 [Christensenellaceae bacterium]